MLGTRELRHVDYIGHKTPETRETQGVRKHVRLKEHVVQKHLEHETRDAQGHIEPEARRARKRVGYVI